MDDENMLPPEQLEAKFMEAFSQLSAEEQTAFQQLIDWIAFDRPKDAEPLTREKMEELLLDIKRENTRRRLGGKVGIILPFKKPEQPQ